MTQEQAIDHLAHAVLRANEEITEAYDKRVYTSNAFPFSAPGNLRAAAHLYGLDSVSLAHARVLELGCAGGGNLLPFATAYPKAHVVGVDLSPVQIAQGQQVVQALGLKNLHLHTMSLTDITQDFGQFDYIIAHGVFSWVPPEVREAIMRIVRDNLSPNGVAYISYNTYPGWKAGDVVRDAMLLHSHSVQDSDDKLAAAKAMLHLLSEGIAASNPLGPSLRAAVDQLQKQSDYYIAHEYLETFNSPCYLLEFVNMAQEHGVMHVGDVEPYTELAASYGQNVQMSHSLVALGQAREMRQQYLDFAVGRNFRKSLVVHGARAADVQISPDLDRLADLRWAAYFRETEPEATTNKERRSFLSYKNRPLHTSEAAVVAVLTALSAVWPASLDVDTLVAQVRSGLRPEQANDPLIARKTVLETLYTLFRLNSLRFTLEASPYDASSTQVETDKPALIPGLAYLISQQQNAAFGVGCYNLGHDTIHIQLKAAEVFLLPYMDGARTRKQLATLLRDALSAGKMPGTDGKTLKGQRNLDGIAEQIVSKLLDVLRRQGALL